MENKDIENNEDEQLDVVQMPVLALRGLTAYPKMLLHFDVGRSISVKALEKSMKLNQMIFLVSQAKVTTEKPSFETLYKIGTICEVKQILKMPDESGVRVLVEGKTRGVITKEIKETPYLLAEIKEIPDIPIQISLEQKQAVSRKLISKFDEYLDYQTKISDDIFSVVVDKIEPSEICDFIAQNIPFDGIEKQDILEERNPMIRSLFLMKVLSKEIEILKIDSEISDKVKDNMEESRREYYLKEQLKVVLAELGEDEGIVAEYENYVENIKKLKLCDKYEKKLLTEAKKMRRLGNTSQEGNLTRNYLDFVINLPFLKETKDKKDILKAEKVLNSQHYGMEKVKERILETIALRIVSENKKGCVICLLGPPGVGKTSIAKSVAKALGRNMARVSLGGVKDESEIRGHRKTYIGAMCGKIIRAINDAQTTNPVILLDEIDKMSTDLRGDPSAAMLEVLDFEQNNTFSDHYLEIPYDLSKVIFIATANNINQIPKPLLDRMEVIELSSYTNIEKFHIAKKHIIPKIIKKYNLKRIKVSDFAINSIIMDYTREAGVRKLEQHIEKIMRKIAYKMVVSQTKSFVIDTNLDEFLGKPRYLKDPYSKRNQIGIVNGLAYTAVGGAILRVEVNVLDGEGKIKLTGNLGDVMKESAQIAISYIRSVAKELGIDADFHKKYDLHIHFPEGATPKDGPSAGITMATAIISALTNKQARADVAMTGEISLRGNVMPIGGLREKSMAAYQNGMKKVIISSENEKDLEDLDKEVLENIEFVIAKDMKTVIKTAIISGKKSSNKSNIETIAKEILKEAIVQ